MPYKSSEGRNGGKLTKSNLSDNIGGYLLKSVANSQYFYDTDTETTLYVEPGIRNIVIAGVAGGGKGGPGQPKSTSGYGGGGGGAGNIDGVTIDAVPLWNQTLYIKVPGPVDSPNHQPVYVKTGSHSGTSLWEAGSGGSGGGGQTGGVGGQMITGFGYDGGAGGEGNPHGGDNNGLDNGSPGTGGGAGGGGGGGHNCPPSGEDGGTGGLATVPSNYLRPLGVGPSPDWTMQNGAAGAGGGNQTDPGNPAPNNGARGGSAGQSWPNPNGGGGGGGGGITVSTPNGLRSYGGGGGGGGASWGSGPDLDSVDNGNGSGGFLIVQLVKHT